MPVVRDEPLKPGSRNLTLKKSEISFNRLVQSIYFDILNRLGVTQEYDRQKDGPIDILLANFAAFNIVARQKNRPCCVVVTCADDRRAVYHYDQARSRRQLLAYRRPALPQVGQVHTDQVALYRSQYLRMLNTDHPHRHPVYRAIIQPQADQVHSDPVVDRAPLTISQACMYTSLTTM